MTEATDRHDFWADEIADRILARNPEDPIVVKGGISPSGVPHLGNANEIVLGYFVAEVLRERGREVRQVFTTDDRDPLRSLPRTLADLDGNLVDLGDVDAGVLGRNLGHPYTGIPDPFGCCDSYGDHFSRLIEDIGIDLDIPLEVVSTTDLYDTGAFDDAIRTVLGQRERAAEVLGTFQASADQADVPFKVHCESCGKETDRITDVNLEQDTVSYRCTDIEAGDRTIEGCGATGTTSIRNGKLPWRFEWVAQWAHFGVDFEPFGKDHAEGSWPSGQAIAEEIFDVVPPVPFTYEWFTLEGQPFSSSEGNVVLVSEVLELVERAVLLAFFADSPGSSSDFSIERIDRIVDRFDRLEATALGRADGEGGPDVAYAERVYPFLVEAVRPERVRIPYRFAAVLGMTDDPATREAIARKQDHVPPDAPDWAVEGALERVTLARRWARRTDNEYNYALQRTSLPDVSLEPPLPAALDDLADTVEAGVSGEELQGTIFETARRHDVEPGELFSAGYELFLGRPDGPQLGPFLAGLDRAFVVDRLRRER